MSRVFASLAMSLDGYVAGPDDGPGQPLGRGGDALFAWFRDGDTPSRHYPSFSMAAENAHILDAIADRIGAVVTGRRTHDIANAWHGRGPLPGAPLFVLTHHPPADGPAAYTYVTGGIEQAIGPARTAAAGRDVALMGSQPVKQALAAGLLDELHIPLIPVILGGGVSLFQRLEHPVRLSCEDVQNAPGVVHLHYRVL